MAINFTVYYKISFAGGKTWDAHETVFASTADEAKQITRKRIERKFGAHSGFEFLEMNAE